MSVIDWERLTIHHRAAFEAAGLDQLNRNANLDSLKMLKDLKREILRDSVMNDFEPQGMDELDEMIERVLGRLTHA